MSGDPIRLLNLRTRNRLERHRKNYATVTGKPFEHFYCPFLFVDEAVEVMRGHIINEAFHGSSKAWVVQRKDVDGFYGGFFEGDFELFQYMHGASTREHFTNPKLFGGMRPRIYCNDVEIKYFLANGKPTPSGFQFVAWEMEGGIIDINVKATVEQMLLMRSAWTYETGKDLRIPAFVSLMKAAHLSMFSLLDYRYALSNTGRFLGSDILGRFFRENSDVSSKKEAQRRAFPFFRPYRHMIRPLEFGSSTLDGSLTDGIIHLCVTDANEPWAMIIFMRTGQHRHAAIVPYSEGDSSLPAYLEFLNNDQEQIQIVRGAFDSPNERWTFENRSRPLRWPKDGMIYPESIS